MTSTPNPPVALEEAAPSRFLQARTPSLARDLWTMTKPEITFLVVLSALAGFLLGSPASVDGFVLFVTLLGVALTSAGGAVMNHVFEHRYDATMHRTTTRPIPAGRVDAKTAWRFGFTLIAAGVGIICPLVNPLTAGLAILTVVLYLYVYTPLKRVSSWNTLVGTIPGALPALGGYTAATGSVGAPGWAVFLILALWQMPHFLALAWMYRKDYARGGYRMTSVSDARGTRTALEMLLYTVLLLAASVLPVWTGASGWLYGGLALALGAWFLGPVIRFCTARTTHAARRVLKASVIYIPLLVLALILDWLARA